MSTTNSTFPSYPLHRFCELVPEADEKTFNEIVESIKQDGLQEPIVLYDGTILDGRTRYEACKKANAEPKFVEFEEVCPSVTQVETQEERNTIASTWVITKNLRRRHLNDSQRAVLASELAPFGVGQSRADAKAMGVIGFTRDEAAAMAGVSPALISQASKVKKEAPEKVADIQSGKTTVTRVTDELRAKELQKQKKELDAGLKALADGVYTGKAFRQKVGEFAKHVEKCTITVPIVDYISAHAGIMAVEDMIAAADIPAKSIPTRELKKRLASLQQEKQKLLDEIANVYVFCTKTYHECLATLKKGALADEEKELLASVEEQFAERWSQVQSDRESMKTTQYKTIKFKQENVDPKECDQEIEDAVTTKINSLK